MEQPSSTAERTGLSFFSSQRLRTRLLTGILTAAVAVVALSSTSLWPSVGLLIVFGVVSSVELCQLLRAPWWGVLPATAMMVAGLLNLAHTWPMPWASLLVAAAGAGAALAHAVSKKRSWLDFFALGWVAAPMACGLWLHQASAMGSGRFAGNLLLLTMLPLWFGDSLAYFVGKAYGKKLMAPAISPKKTWEGAAANLFGCMASALLIGAFMEVPTGPSLAVGLSCGTIGQMGDLLQSSLKRAADLKDSGWLLPGHGGVLDRIDSFLLSSVPSTLVLWLTSASLFHVKP